jgi:CDP-glucose 4,6-dehydratase
LYAGRKVLLTGHTGFKGGWLACWLKHLGADVTGLALPPDTEPSIYRDAGLEELIVSMMGDIREPEVVAEAMRESQPEIVFHLAAQSLVRRSYRDPIGTYATNVMGTVHVLEAVRRTPSVRVVVIVTSDKCYENRDWVYSYREIDPMGGHDPYSSSKGCAELVTKAYRESFFSENASAGLRPAAVDSARAGNVIGGGDWAEDRLLPDCIRALEAGQPIAVRNPEAVRPWQHVLEPLSGYLWLAAVLWEQGEHSGGGWNFGPPPASFLRVRELSELVLQAWGDGRWEDISSGRRDDPGEAAQLRLDSTKATTLLGWQPIYTVQESVQETVAWYRDRHTQPDFDGYGTTVRQIQRYTARALAAGLTWPRPPGKEPR